MLIIITCNFGGLKQKNICWKRVKHVTAYVFFINLSHHHHTNAFKIPIPFVLVILTLSHECARGYREFVNLNVLRRDCAVQCMCAF
jgi:hypothetical protein